MLSIRGTITLVLITFKLVEGLELLDTSNSSVFWLLAAKAKCLASGTASKELSECIERPTHKDIPISTLSNWKLTPPKLFCRQESFLVLQWALHNVSTTAAFILEIRNISKPNTWIPYNATQSVKETVSDLTPGTEYQVRVRVMALDGWLGEPMESDWISTLPANFQPKEVTNVRLTKIELGKMYPESALEARHPSLILTVAWDPSEDLTCYYDVIYSSNTDPIYPNPKEIKNDFKAVLDNVKYDMSYNITVQSKDEARYLESETVLYYRTPTCLNKTNGNLTICSPPKPINVTVNVKILADGKCNLKVNWKSSLPKYVPDDYLVEVMSQDRPSKNASHKMIVPGNVTEAYFSAIYLGMKFFVVVYAKSTGGTTKGHGYFVRNEHEEVEEDFTGAVATYIPLVFLFLGGCAALVMTIRYRLKKQKEKKRICQYFENLENEPPKENNISEQEEIVSDEWEVPNACLKLEDILGEGAFGVVRKGLLRDPNDLEMPLKHVAVKMLRDDATDEDVHHFKQEIKMMKSVGQHPNIVSIIGCCMRASRLQLIVEYCAFGDLQQYLRKICAPSLGVTSDVDKKSGNHQIKYAELMKSAGSAADVEYENHRKGNNIVENQSYFNNGEDEKPPPQETLNSSDLLSFARQIAIGMEYLAVNRIVHRDLAARNVLVSNNKNVKISDFGLSRDIYEQNIYRKRGDGKLPIKWMAIESLLYQVYTTQSDVWSYGVLLWEIVTMGGNPYPCIPTNSVFKMLKTGYRMECPSSCSAELYSIMLSCWLANPKQRPTFTDLHYKIDQLLESSAPQQYLNLNLLDYDSPVTSLSTIENPSCSSQSHGTDEVGNSSQSPQVEVVYPHTSNEEHPTERSSPSSVARITKIQMSEAS